MASLTADSEMKAYYQDRAPVYDRVYQYPERQSDLRVLEKYIAGYFANRNVLEIAAGTGYWTQIISTQAASMFAIDATAAALEQLKDRKLLCQVQTSIADAYHLDFPDDQFNAAFAGLWFSHVPLEKRQLWVSALHAKLAVGSRVLLLDNSIAQCERLPISYTDEIGNTYQDRQTDVSESYRVLKNFPTEDEMIDLVAGVAEQARFVELDHFWYFEYRVK